MRFLVAVLMLALAAGVAPAQTAKCCDHMKSSHRSPCQDSSSPCDMTSAVPCAYVTCAPETSVVVSASEHATAPVVVSRVMPVRDVYLASVWRGDQTSPPLPARSYLQNCVLRI